ncbi:MAG: ABC transporter permease [Actinobacteria bacterium]|nr:ABC transporter permease [Actinomycetota bacterium]
MSDAAPTASDSIPAARTDAPQSVGAAIRDFWNGLRAGDLGSLPIIFGLLVIVVIFSSKNENFLTAGNFVNLMVQMAGVTTIAIGVVFVLLLGEIDLSVGFVSGVAGVTVAKLVLPDANQTSAFVAIAAALVVGAAIGLLQGTIVAKIGVPSFVVTLAGLLAWQGVVLLAIGEGGTIVIQDQRILDIANRFLSDRAGWLLAALAIALYAGTKLLGILGRRRAGLPSGSLAVVGAKLVAFAAAILAVVAVSNRDRGFPLVGVIVAALLVFWTYVAKRTAFGRHVYAVGGNAEAARRSGINVDRVRIAVFMLCSAMAAFGGIILASRLFSVDTNAGGGTLLLDAIAAAVIGGTSLFGGRGEVKSALLGALVIVSVANGMGLLGLSAGLQFLVTGLILLAAVTVDSLSRKRLAAVGR